jgi:ribosomal protein S18 acetylase RimI-like enzyme
MIRIATPKDASLLAEVSLRTFRHIFAPHNTASDMEMYVSSAFGEAQQLAELEDPKRIIALTYDGDFLVGYYHLVCGQTHKDVQDQNPIELKRLYLDESVTGKGFGKMLMDDILLKSKSLGFKTIWLGVWENNFRAIAFYKKYGFKQVGGHDFLMGTDIQHDLVFSKIFD